MKPRLTLGIHIGHDRGAALVREGDLYYSLAQERVDRRKHSPSPELPFQAIDSILNSAGLTIGDIDAVGMSYTNVHIDAIIDDLADELRDHYAAAGLPVVGAGHHYCHALSAYHTSGFEECDILIADGAGDIVDAHIEAESLYRAYQGDLRLVERRLQDFTLTYTWRRNSFLYSYMHDVDKSKQVSIGRKYEQITYLIGFHHGEAGKTMALASYGTSLLPNFRVDATGLVFDLRYSHLLAELDEIRRHKGIAHHSFVKRYRADIARTVQDFVENLVLEALQTAKPKLQGEQLCLAGGLFLNCLLNHKIVKEAGWTRLHIVPAAGDDGQAAGAALHAYRTLFGHASVSSPWMPFLGLEHTEGEIRKALNHFMLPYRQLSDESLALELARILQMGKVVGLLRGRSEFGPRALCHRSILADPRPAEMRNHLNEHVKYREMFRPFAPVVTAEQQFKYFELSQDSPYMLLAASVRPEYRDSLAAITHVDGTARVQALTVHQDPFIHRLLVEFEQLTGFPIILNTSFNLAGEPIVESPHDAVSTFLRSRIDVLVLGNYIVETKQRDNTIEVEDRSRFQDPYAQQT